MDCHLLSSDSIAQRWEGEDEGAGGRRVSDRDITAVEDLSGDFLHDKWPGEEEEEEQEEKQEEEEAWTAEQLTAQIIEENICRLKHIRQEAGRRVSQ